MSGKKKKNLNEKDDDFRDKKQLVNLEIGNETTDSDYTVETPYDSSEDADHDQQHSTTEDIEVNPSDILVTRQLYHGPLEKYSGESSQYEVIEFSSDSGSDGDISLSEASVVDAEIPSRKSSTLHLDEDIFDFLINEIQDDKLPGVFDSKVLNKEAADLTCTAGTSGETGQKRKNRPNSLMQNKRCKEGQRPDSPLVQISCQDKENLKVFGCRSEEFADVEDNVKSSSSSDFSDSNFTTESTKQLPLNTLSTNVQQEKEEKDDPLFGSKNMNGNQSCGSNAKSYQNDKIAEDAAENLLFPISLKGEKLPAFKLSEEAKRKFELSMPTILEVRESESDEKISQPLQSKTNPLKMKTVIGKRKDKCNVCNARLGLCAIGCRCGGYFCAKHRYDKEHNCNFDYRSMGAEEIRKNNPKIVAEKVQKL